MRLSFILLPLAAPFFCSSSLGLEISGKQVSENRSKGMEIALKGAGKNASELRAAFAKIDADKVEGLAFLIEHMPDRDLQNLSSDFLVENVNYAYLARFESPWAKAVPEEMFLNNVLPYASINERRDRWRKDFHTRFVPLIKDCKTPGEAAQILNKKMWGIVDVRYHARKRPKPDQSPYESMDAKFASCSGLSVLLVDACRSVGVPARFVGTPLWSNKRGNHSWVEVWDGKSWQFTGACEYSSTGLGHAWFKGAAGKAIKDDPRHAIYATSWKKSDAQFPLVWDLSINYVQAENVTDRYTGKSSRRVFIQLFDVPGGERVAADVEVWTGGKKVESGRTRDSTNDTNDMLGMAIKGNLQYELRIARKGGEILVKPFKVSGKGDEQIEFFLSK